MNLKMFRYSVPLSIVNFHGRIHWPFIVKRRRIFPLHLHSLAKTTLASEGSIYAQPHGPTGGTYINPHLSPYFLLHRKTTVGSVNMAPRKSAATAKSRKKKPAPDVNKAVKRPARGYHKFKSGLLNVTPKGGEIEM